MSQSETFIVEDMHCNACENTITKTLSNNENISSVKTNLETKEVTVDFDSEKLDVEEILSSLDNIGFPATLKKNHKYCWYDLCNVYTSSNYSIIKNRWNLFN